MASDADPETVHRLKSRDKSAWNAVSTEYTGDLFGFVIRLVGFNRSVAEDIVQDVWLESLNRIRHYDPDRGEFRTWIFAIARRRVAACWRRRDSAAECEALPDDILPDPQLLPTELLDRLDRSAVVRAALLSMAPARRRALVAKYQDEKTVAEIAAAEGKSVKAIESLLSRAREELRGLLGPHFDSMTQENAMLRRSDTVPVLLPETHS